MHSEFTALFSTIHYFTNLKEEFEQKNLKRLSTHKVIKDENFKIDKKNT